MGRRLIFYISFILLLIYGVPLWGNVNGGNNSVSPEVLFTEAERLYKDDQKDRALDILRRLRITAPGSDAFYKSLLLSARITVDQNESYKARYFLKKLVTESFNKELSMEGSFLLGDICYKERLFSYAFSYYDSAVQLSRLVYPGIHPRLSRVFLKLGEMAFYQKEDIQLARSYFLQVKTLFLDEEEKALYRLLEVKLAWKNFYPADMGIEDGNISALAVDGDDLWIGTWNGGILRYSYSTDRFVLFEEGKNSIADNTIRAIGVTDTHVWVGTYNGLSVYNKASSSWRMINKLGGRHPGKISVISEINDIIYVGTLGNGLWRLSGKTWEQVGNSAGLGDYILSLAHNEKNIFIGTMTGGIFIYQPEQKAINSFDNLNTGLKARNITLLICDRYDRLWIGTYGEGLFMWDGKKLTGYDKESGRIGDNWVLSGAEGEDGIYFGTFGGGASFFSFRSLQWKKYGIEEGLSSPDISSMTYSAPAVYFGTLGAGISIFRERIYE